VVTITATPAADAGHLNLTVGEGAGVHLILPELPKRGSVVIEVGSGAQFTLSVAASVQHKHAFECLVRLVGDGSKAHAQLALVGTGESEAELALTLEHAARATFGRMVVRRVQKGSAFSVLKGMLKVAPGAHGTDTYLSDKALLIGETARAESNPGLEILADDVRASHGATVGQLSPDELFYVRSRGLPEPLAQELLIHAFLSSALVGVPPVYQLKMYATQ
jgi:Fe-S cluster assembly protein SufD